MKVKHGTAIIAASGTTSNAIETGTDNCFVGFYTPASLTGTSFTFQASPDNSTFYNVLDEGTSYSVTVAASRYVSVKPAVFVGARYIKIVSGSTESSERTITTCFREVA